MVHSPYGCAPRARRSCAKLGLVASLRLCVISLRYSSWSIRAWLALTHAGARFETITADVELGKLERTSSGDAEPDASATSELSFRRSLGSVAGLFPVLHVDGTPIHDSLAICEWANDAYSQAGLWPEDPLARARARAISAEMHSGFLELRTHLSCHLFGRVPSFVPNAATRREIARVFEIWSDALESSGGPFLFGRFGIADAMYYPVRARFRTYGVAIPDSLAAYVRALDELPAVAALEAIARSSPAVPVYDAYLRSLGGDPVAALATP